MNEFFKIGKENSPLDDSYILENQGVQRVFASIVPRSSRNSYDTNQAPTQRYYESVKPEHYDCDFAYRIVRTRPPYEIDKLINYHYDYYLKNGGNAEKFIKHIKYVIMPMIEKMKETNVYVELVNEWIEGKNNNSKKKQAMSININGNGNNVNNAGGDIHQIGTTINVTDNQYKELKELGVEESHISELREIVSDNSHDKPTLKSKIGKWLSAVTVSVATKGLIDNLPKLQEFAHHLMP